MSEEKFPIWDEGWGSPNFTKEQVAAFRGGRLIVTLTPHSNREWMRRAMKSPAENKAAQAFNFLTWWDEVGDPS